MKVLIFSLLFLASVNAVLKLNDGVWQSVSTLNNPGPNSWHDATADGGNMYVATTSGAFYQYSPVTKSWFRVGDLPSNLTASDLEVAGGLIFAFGGSKTDGQGYVNDVSYFAVPAPSLGWKDFADANPPTQRNGHTLTSLGGVMYVFGGWNATQYLQDTWWFDTTVLYLGITTATWQQSNSSRNPPPRNSHSAVGYGGDLYVFGGFYHNMSLGPSVQCDEQYAACTYYNDLWFYSSRFDKWTQLVPSGASPSGRWGHSANVIGENMYVFGGTTGPSVAVNDMWAYSFVYQIWQQLNPAGAVPSPRYYHSAVNLGGITIYGGQTASQAPLSDVYVYNPHSTPDTVETDTSSGSTSTSGLVATVTLNVLTTVAIGAVVLYFYRTLAGKTSVHTDYQAH